MRHLRRLLGSTAVLATAVAVLVSTAPARAESRLCGAGTHGSSGYAYAGHQGTRASHGVRATISSIVRPAVAAGHVAGWIGVGGPGQGPNGETEWIQVGLAAMPDTPTMVYAEVALPGAEPVFLPLLRGVDVGERHDLAVLEVRGSRDHWRVWLDGRAVTEPIHLPGSHRRWKPIATAESYDDRTQTCNVFGFRFERVGFAKSPGGSWRAFVPGYDFLDDGYALRKLRPLTGGALRTLASDPISAYAFEATST